MDFRRVVLPLLGQIGVFVLGGLGWLAVTHGLYASALLCGLSALLLAATGLTTLAFSVSRDWLRRNAQAGSVFTAELSRRRLQVLLDQAPSPLLLQPDNGQLIAVNRAARQLFDVSYALPVAARKALLGESSEAMGLARLDEQVKWKGRTFAVHLAETQEDERMSHLAVLTDISADVRAAEAGALRDLLKVLNHELMNALTPVASMSKSALDLLGDDTPEARGQAMRALERVVARTEGLTGFINAYRALTRLPPPSVRPVGLALWLEVLSESFAAQWGDKDVGFEANCDCGDALVMMDEDQMWLAAANLLNNGAQAALEKPEPRVRVVIRRVDEDVAFEIEDSGAGIPDKQADQVFLPFYSTKATGTGVGLSLARQIVHGHGGALHLLPAAPGDVTRLGGARFAFRLRTEAV